MNAPAFSLPNTESPELRAETAVVLTEAKALTVTDVHTYGLAAERVKGLKSLQKKVTDWFEPLVTAAHRAHKELTSRRGETLKPIEAECARLTREMSTWKAEEDRRAREEAARLAREQQALEQRVQLEVAAALESQGLNAEAEAVVEQAIAMPAPMVPVIPVTPDVQGITYRTTWKHQVVDAALVPREYLVIDEQKIAAVVRATKGTLQIPGVRIYSEHIAVVRGA
jgi:hypothetical protein